MSDPSLSELRREGNDLLHNRPKGWCVSDLVAARTVIEKLLAALEERDRLLERAAKACDSRDVVRLSNMAHEIRTLLKGGET